MWAGSDFAWIIWSISPINQRRNLRARAWAERLLANVIAGSAFAQIIRQVAGCGSVPQHGLAADAFVDGVFDGLKSLAPRHRGRTQHRDVICSRRLASSPIRCSRNAHRTAPFLRSFSILVRQRESHEARVIIL
jgi:hypothetical protein